jgi:alpha-galactosidase
LPEAAGAARYDAATRSFRLDGGGVSYVFGVNEKGLLQSIYWGPRLAAGDLAAAQMPKELSSFDPAASVTPQEYPGWGGGLYSEPVLKLAFADGARDVVLVYRGHRIEGDAIAVELGDIDGPVRVALRYRIDPATGIVSRSAEIVNAGPEAIRIDQAHAAAWSLPCEEDYRLHFLTGHWASEFTLQTRPVTQGRTVIESRRGSTGVQANPWFAISRDGRTTEEAGPVWFGALGWSGSWAISVDRGALGDVRVVGGFNPFDFAYLLEGGETLTTPEFHAGYADDGLGGASRLMHRFIRARILPRGEEAPLRPVLYNSWEATHFAVDEAGQKALAERAAKIGAERFVMDDGWFSTRDSDASGLGDWWVSPTKFPNGLTPLIDHVRSLGMDFGLWVEPEMVNPKSKLYAAHPDWVIGFAGRPKTEARNQLVLNLAREDVRAYLLDLLDRLLSENDIAFLKWDHNRNWSEPGWPDAAPERQQRLYVDYVEGLYAILAELRRRHPKLEIESCAGGGGRVDLGILRLTDQVWPSDNSDPFDRLAIQHGFTQAYPASTMVAWVTASPHWVNRRMTSLGYRFLSAMQGALGIGDNLNAWDDKHLDYAARMIAAYKDVRPLVQRGDLYRLVSPLDGSTRSATLYVAPDRSRAVLFAFLHSSTRLHAQSRIRLAGLDPDTRYRMRAIDAAASASDPVQSGAWWMGYGVDLTMRGDFQAAGRVFERVVG